MAQLEACGGGEETRPVLAGPHGACLGAPPVSALSAAGSLCSAWARRDSVPSPSGAGGLGRSRSWF